MRELRHTVRGLLRAPAFAVTALLILAAGIGVSVTGFALLYSVVLRPLPFADADRLAWIRSADHRTPATEGYVHIAQYLAWREQADRFDALAAWNAAFTMSAFNLSGLGEPERLDGIAVSPSLFRLTGGRSIAGRLFVDADEQLGASAVVVLGEGFWRRRFGGRPDIVGQTMNLNGQPHSVIGVVGREWTFPATFTPRVDFDVYVPVVLDPAAANRGFYLAVIGRLRPDATGADAASQLAGIQRTLAAGRPMVAQRVEQVIPLKDHVTAASRRPLLLLLAGVLLVLLLACANLANLQLARINNRGRELAVRAALGASRGRLVRDMLLESAVLSAVAAAIGLIITAAMLRGLSSAPWLTVPRATTLGVGFAAVAFTVVSWLLTAAAIGWIAAWRGSRIAGDALRRHGTLSSVPTSPGLQSSLTVAQIALAFVLVASSTLLARSFTNLNAVTLGFDPRGVVGMRIDPGTRYSEPAAMEAFLSAAIARVAAVPGVQSAAIGMNVPLDRHMLFVVGKPGVVYSQGDQPPMALTQIATPGYLDTLGIQLLAGRDFSSADRAGSARVAIVNDRLARDLYGDREGAIGKPIEAGGGRMEIVGVADDVRHTVLSEPAGPQIYLPLSQMRGFTAFDLVIRTATPAEALVPSIREAIWQVAPTQAVGRPFVLDNLLRQSLGPRRFAAIGSSALGSLALLVAATGLYGLIAYVVSMHRQDIGVRMALGARRTAVVRMVISRGVQLATAGVALGVIGAVGVSRVLEGTLFGIAPSDPLTYAGTASALLLVTTVACAIPALRASRIDPLVALRTE